MGGRYFLTGVQLGLLISDTSEKNRMKILQEIMDNQFIDNIEEGENKKVEIVDKNE